MGGLKGKYRKKAAARFLAWSGEQTTAGVVEQPAGGSCWRQVSEAKPCSLYGLVAGGPVETGEVTAGQRMLLGVRGTGRRTPSDCRVTRARRGQDAAKET